MGTRADSKGVFLALLLFSLFIPAWAQGPRPAAPSSAPDVLVLLYVSPQGEAQVGLTYAGRVPRTQVQRDLAALRRNTGWTLSDSVITDAPPPIAGSRGMMTSVETVAPGAVDTTSHLLPLEPVVRALKSYRHIVLTYFTPSGFAYQGLRGFSDHHVQIALAQHGSAYTYQIAILDPHFDRLNLPLYDLNTPASRVAVAAPLARQRPNPWLVAGTLAAAIGAGGVVYFALARGGR